MILPQRDVENRTSKESVQTFDPYPGCLSAFPTNQVTNYMYLLPTRFCFNNKFMVCDAWFYSIWSR